MEDKNQSNISPVQPFPITPHIAPASSTNWSKIVLFVILGLIAIAGSVFVGIQVGKNQTTNQKLIEAQPMVIPTQTLTNPTTNLMTNWKSYTNNEFGIEFKYPPEWNLSYFPNVTFLVVLSNEPIKQLPKYPNDLPEETILIGVKECFNTQFDVHTACEIAKNDSYLLDFSNFKSDSIERKDIKIGSKVGKQTKGIYNNESSVNTYYIGTFFPWKNKNSFQIVSRLYKDEDTLQVYNQILSTFKFVN